MKNSHLRLLPLACGLTLAACASTPPAPPSLPPQAASVAVSVPQVRHPEGERPRSGGIAMAPPRLESAALWPGTRRT